MLLPGCSRTKPMRRAKQKAMRAADRAACLLPFKTQRRRKSPRGFRTVHMVEFLLMNTHVEHTVPSHIRPVRGSSTRSICRACINPQVEFKSW